MKRVMTILLLLALLSGLLGGCALRENPDFRFKLNKDRKSYTLVEYVGDDEDVEIPKTHRDKPVTAIDGFADNKNIETVEIPRGIQRIESHAFTGCANLESVDFPKTLTYIGDYAFRDCGSLKEVVIPKGAHLGMQAFAGCSELETVQLGLDGDGDEEYEIEIWAFTECESLTVIRIGDAYTELDRCSLADCVNLRELYLPVTLERIGMEALTGCESLEVIHYAGTAEQWQRIDIHEYWIYGDVTIRTQ